jgi:signal transduction histidine kinase
LSRTFTITEEFVNVTAALSASLEDRDAADKRRDAGLAEVWREVRAEGPSAIAMSGHLLVHRVLDEMRGGVGQLPSYAEWLASGAPRQALGKMSESIHMQLRCVGLTSSFAIEFGDVASTVKVFTENLEHDLLGHYCYLRDILSFAGRMPRKDKQIEYEVRHALDVEAPFIRQVLGGTCAIAFNLFDIAACCPGKMAVTAAAPIATRFGCRLVVNGEEVAKGRESGSTIEVVFDPSANAFCDPNALGLVMYNLVKNPIKLAKFGHRPYPNVQIEVVPSSDGGCTSIFVRDDGIGVSHDALRTQFTERAMSRLKAGVKLAIVEECILDELWAPHVPPVALTNLLLDRGATTGHGTGIGLSLARTIVMDGHQGFIQLYDHPSRGAGVQILIPHVGTEAGEEVRRRITLKSLEHQLATGLPVWASKLA